MCVYVCVCVCARVRACVCEKREIEIETERVCVLARCICWRAPFVGNCIHMRAFALVLNSVARACVDFPSFIAFVS